MKPLLTIIMTLPFFALSQQLVWEKVYDSVATKYVVISIDKNSVTGNFHCFAGSNMIGGAFLEVDQLNGNSIKVIKYDSLFRVDIMRNPILDQNGGFILASRNIYNGVDTNYLGVKKYDNQYKLIWEKKYGLPCHYEINPVSILLQDSKYYVFSTGQRYNVPSCGQLGYIPTIHIIDTLGNLIKSNSWNYPIPKWSAPPEKMIRYGVNNFLLYGLTNYPLGFFPYFIKMNPEGDTLTSYNFKYPLPKKRYLYNLDGDVINTNDGAWTFSGVEKDSSSSTISLPFIAKIDTNFNTKWYRSFRSVNGYVPKCVLLPDSNILLVYYISKLKPINLYKINVQTGDIMDSATIMSNLVGDGRTLYLDNNFLICGGASSSYAYVAKIDLGKMLPTGIPKEIKISETNFTLSPNPNNGKLDIHTLQFGNLEIYDTKGTLLKKQRIESLTEQIDILELKAGVYLYRFSMSDGVKYGKIVKE